LEELYQRGFPGKANSLIVTDVQGYFLMRAAAAVSPSYLHDHVSEVRRGLSEGLIGDVFLVDVFPESIHSPTGDLARALRAPLIDRVGFGGAEIRIFLLPK
jgi:hypothetical protein